MFCISIQIKATEDLRRSKTNLDPMIEKPKTEATHQQLTQPCEAIFILVQPDWVLSLCSYTYASQAASVDIQRFNYYLSTDYVRKLRLFNVQLQHEASPFL